MPGNNWLPGEAPFSGCSSGVERVPWAHEVAGAIPVIPTRKTMGAREPGRRSRAIVEATMRRRAFPARRLKGDSDSFSRTRPLGAASACQADTGGFDSCRLLDAPS